MEGSDILNRRSYVVEHQGMLVTLAMIRVLRKDLVLVTLNDRPPSVKTEVAFPLFYLQAEVALYAT